MVAVISKFSDTGICKLKIINFPVDRITTMVEALILA